MEEIVCACGCGLTRPAVDKKGRAMQFINQHHRRMTSLPPAPQVACACGCGSLRPARDARGRYPRFIDGHQQRQRTTAQKHASAANIKKAIEIGPWNKGQTYVIGSRPQYKTRDAFQDAVKRRLGNRCGICGWDAGSCDVHHITPRADDGRHQLENGIVVCPNCHRKLHFG